MKLISATKAPLFFALVKAIEIKVIKLVCCKTVFHFRLLLHFDKISLSPADRFVNSFNEFFAFYLQISKAIDTNSSAMGDRGTAFFFMI